VSTPASAGPGLEDAVEDVAVAAAAAAGLGDAPPGRRRRGGGGRASAADPRAKPEPMVLADPSGLSQEPARAGGDGPAKLRIAKLNR
jgi:hypothetical protein